MNAFFIFFSNTITPFVNAMIFGLLTMTMLSAAQAQTPSINEADAQKNKSRIIALAPHIVEMLFSVGAGGQIVGTSAYADYPEEAKSIPEIGNYVRLQIERVIELQPDLIIAWKNGNPSNDLARLTKLGFNVVYSQPKKLEDIATELAYFGEITGHKAQGNKVATAFLTELKTLTNQYQYKTEVTVFYELWSRPLTSIGASSWPQQHLKVCRAKNPFESAKTPYPQLNIEQVLQHPIDLIIQPLSINQKDREAFNWQPWQIIPAVKNKRIIQPDADILHRMSVRALNELALLCKDIDQVRQQLATRQKPVTAITPKL